MTELLIARDTFSINEGSPADYAALATHHYRSGRPFTMTSIWIMVHQTPGALSRFLGRPDGDRVVAGVVVLSYPPLACRLRDMATGGRYVGLSPSERASVLNREMRTISRVIVDPRYRGLGLAVRLVRHALSHAETVYTEALAAMGAVNPFFERAGMTRYERPPHPIDGRLVDVLGEMSWRPCDLAAPQLMLDRLNHVPEARRVWFGREIQRWARSSYRAADRSGRRRSLSLREILTLARDHLVSSPIYYLARTPPEVEKTT